MYTFQFDLTMLEEGFDYRFCTDLNVTHDGYFYGDVGYLIYITPVVDADVSIILGPSPGSFESSYKIICPNCTAENTTAVIV